MIFNNYGYYIEIANSSVGLPPGQTGMHLASNADWIKVNSEDWVCLTDVGTRHSWEWRQLLETCKIKEDVEAFISLLKEENEAHYKLSQS